MAVLTASALVSLVAETILASATSDLALGNGSLLCKGNTHVSCKNMSVVQIWKRKYVMFEYHKICRCGLAFKM